MKKSLCIYASKYGSCAKYVDFIQQKLGCDTLVSEEFTPQVLDNYDIIIFAGSIYAGTMSIIKLLRESEKALKNKELYIVGVGMKEKSDELVNQLVTSILPSHLQNIPFIYARGDLNISQLHFLDKLIIRILKRKIQSMLNENNNQSWIDEKWLNPLYELILQNNI